MIIWIDGTFGSGKTSVATEIYNKIGENVIIFDPDSIINENPMILLGGGALPQNNINFLKKCVEKIEKIYDDSKIVMIPMALTEKECKNILFNHFENVLNLHFILEVSKDVLEKRIKNQDRDKSFALSFYNSNSLFLKNQYEDAIYINVDKKDVNEVSDEIISIIKNNLTEM